MVVLFISTCAKHKASVCFHRRGFETDTHKWMGGLCLFVRLAWLMPFQTYVVEEGGV